MGRNLLRTTTRAPAAALAIAVAGPAAAAPISIDYAGGDPPPAPGFTWQGLDFALDPQPGGNVNAAHRVEGDSDGPLDLFLEEPGKVSYRAELDAPGSGRQRIAVDWIYGADLSSPTPAFSFIQPLLRTLDGSGASTALEGLGGSDAGNPNSPFTGVGARPEPETSGGFDSTDFVNNHALGTTASYVAEIAGDGSTRTSVAIDGASAALQLDLTPGSTGDGFYIEDLILQAGSFQDPGGFAEQFGDTGQRFTYVDAEVSEVPLPGTGALLIAGAAGLLGLGARRR